MRAHTSTRARMHARIHTYTCTRASTRKHTCTHTLMHAHTHTHTHTSTHTHTHTHIHTRTHTHTHARARARARERTYALTRNRDTKRERERERQTDRQRQTTKSQDLPCRLFPRKRTDSGEIAVASLFFSLLLKIVIHIAARIILYHLGRVDLGVAGEEYGGQVPHPLVLAVSPPVTFHSDIGAMQCTSLERW